MNCIHPEPQDARECPLQEFVTEVRSVHDKFARLSEGYRDIAETLSQAAARLRTIAAAKD